AEIRVENAVNRLEIWHCVATAVGQGDVVGSNRAAELRQRLQRWRYQVQVQPEVAIRLAGHSVGIPQQGQTVTVNVTQAQGGVAAELVLHRKIRLLHIRTAEIRREHQQRWCAPSARWEAGQAGGKVHDGAGIAEARPRTYQELARYAIGECGLGDVQQVLLDIKQAKRAAHHRAVMRIERVSKPDARRNVVFAVIDLARHREGGIANRRLRQHLQIVARAVVEAEPLRGPELVLREQRIGRRRKLRRGFSERLQVQLKGAAGHVRQAAKAVLALGTVNKI